MSGVPVITQPDSPIWLPGSKGATDIEVWRIQLELSRYDERLVIGRHEHDGQWVIFRKMPPGGDWPELFPILGLTHPPHDARALTPHYVMRRVRKADLQRRGQEVLAELEQSQEQWRADRARESMESAEVAAEVFEFAHRRSGTHPSTRVYMGEGRRRGYGEHF